MALGGPVWHASVGGGEFAPHVLRHLAYDALAGVGDARLGQWEDDRPIAFHLRRRLSAEEEKLVGPVLDVRGTDEARLRLRQAMEDLPSLAHRFALAEVLRL